MAERTAELTRVNTELAEAIKATLATLKANGQYAALIKKYNLESID